LLGSSAVDTNFNVCHAAPRSLSGVGEFDLFSPGKPEFGIHCLNEWKPGQEDPRTIDASGVGFNRCNIYWKFHRLCESEMPKRFPQRHQGRRYIGLFTKEIVEGIRFEQGFNLNGV
jgi:hypothetical protein